MKQRHFVKRPIVIEAVPMSEVFRGDMHELPSWVNAAIEDRSLTFNKQRDVAMILTLEGLKHAGYNDWLLRGINGELYPCKPDVFERTYESHIANGGET